MEERTRIQSVLTYLPTYHLPHVFFPPFPCLQQVHKILDPSSNENPRFFNQKSFIMCFSHDLRHPARPQKNH
jgi:hypothetical protein